jgi:LCP family protein required for cell wall assembly
VVGFLAILFISRANQVARTIMQEDPRQRTEQGQAEVAASEQDNTADISLNPFNVLLLGVDSRDNPDDGARSDTLIVVHVDPEEHWASMLSIPRDSVTQVPYLGQQKINAAYTYGYMNASEVYGTGTEPAAAGGALAAETVEEFLGIRIDYIAQVDFHGFEQIIDTFGGLTIDVPEALLDPEYPTADYGYERIYVPAGLQVMDGTTALRYARSRHSGSDFDRSCRQQRVLSALLREVRQRNILDQVSLLPNLVEDIEQNVSTTLPINDMRLLRSLLEMAQSLTPDRVLRLSINPSNVQVLSERGSDIYWNERDIDILVSRMLAGPTAPPETALVQVQNGAGIHGLATRVTSNLGAQGFTMVEAADAPGTFEHSLIIDYTGRPETRQRLADTLGIMPNYVQPEPTSDSPPAPYNTDIVLVLGMDYQENWASISDSAPPPPPTAPAIATPADEVPNLPPSCRPEF